MFASGQVLSGGRRSRQLHVRIQSIRRPFTDRAEPSVLWNQLVFVGSLHSADGIPAAGCM